MTALACQIDEGEMATSTPHSYCSTIGNEESPVGEVLVLGGCANILLPAPPQPLLLFRVCQQHVRGNDR
jgi:hypothetical protein